MSYPYWVARDPEEEVVTFSDAEWQVMLADPVRFGYACPRGHAIRADDPYYIREGCPICAGINEAFDAMHYELADGSTYDPTAAEVAAFDRWAEAQRAFPLIRCGNCKDRHVGIGGVRSCYEVNRHRR